MQASVLSLQDEVKSWVKFASICRKSGKMALSERTLLSLLASDPACQQGQVISEKYPQVQAPQGRYALTPDQLSPGSPCTLPSLDKFLKLSQALTGPQTMSLHCGVVT